MLTITNEDCMAMMARYPDKHFDLAIVDPPYGINATKMQMGSNPNRKGEGQYPGISTAVKIRKGRLNSGGGKLKNRKLNQSDIDWDYEIPPPEYFAELKRVSKNQIIWGGNYFPLPPTRCILCWDKKQPWENFSQFELAWTSFDKPAGLVSISNTGGANDIEKIHPTQKPIKLYKWCLKRYALAGQIILDTHLGSGTIAIACNEMGFELVACEKNTETFLSSQKFIKQHTDQLKIF